MQIVSANLANAMAKLVAADALPALVGRLILGNLVKRDFQPVVGQVGDGAITTHAEATFQVPDVTKILAVPDLLRLYMEPAVAALEEKIDGDIMALAKSAPDIDPSHWCIEQKCRVVSQRSWLQLRQDQRFSIYQTAGEAGVRTPIDGAVGRDGDVFVFRSQQVGEYDMEFTKSAICLEMRRVQNPAPGSGKLCEYAEIGSFGMHVEMDYRPNTLAQQFTIGVLYGVYVTGNGYLAKGGR